MDKIRIQGLLLYGYHGVYAEENKLGQRFKVNAELHVPLRKAGNTDQLQDTINYAEVCKIIQRIVETQCFQLLEAVAECITTELFATFTTIDEIKLQVIKLHPPLAIHVDGIEVEIHRKRVD